MTTTPTTCTHPDAEAAVEVACGEPQTWYCETMGGCYGEFTVVKPHAVHLFTLHAEGCDRRRSGIPAEWCGCETRKFMGCVDCDKEFPHDVQPSPDVQIWG